MKELFAIMVGGGVGSGLRYLTVRSVQTLTDTHFPFGVLTVNVLGSFVMGLFAAWFLYRFQVDPIWRAMMLVGVLGGFTTFSSFSIDTIYLIQNGAQWLALVNIVTSVVLSVGAAWCGVMLGKLF